MLNLFLKEKITLFCTSVIFIILIFLGTWQIFRLQEKNLYTGTIFKNLQLPAKEIDENSLQLQLYDKIFLEAKPLTDKAMWLYRRHPLAKHLDGAYLMLPVEDNFGNIFISLLGWVEKENQNKILEEIRLLPYLSLTGVLLPTEEESIFIPKNDYSRKICFTLSMEEIGKSLDLNISKYSLAILEHDNKFTTPILRISSDMMVKIKNDHLEYAATWYGLALVLCCLYYIYINKKYKNG